MKPFHLKPRVVLIFNQKQLSKFLKRWPVHGSLRSAYIDFSSGGIDPTGLLAEKGFKQVERSDVNFCDQETFLREYIALMGQTAKTIHTKLWWATDIASKSCFTSKLTFLLDQFVFSVRAVENQKLDCLVLLKPYWILFDSLRAAVRGYGFDCVCFEFAFARWLRLKLKRTKRLLANINEALRITARALYAKITLRNLVEKKLDPTKSYYAIKSFIYDSSFKDGRYSDLFFGFLPDYMAAKKNVALLTHVLGGYLQCVKRIRKFNQKSSYLVMPVEFFLSFSDILAGLREVVLGKIRIPGDLKFFQYPVSDIMQTELNRTRLGVSLEQYLHYRSVKNFSAEVPLEQFLLTCECLPWEKMCIMALREFSPKTLVIGYQHAIVAQASANMFMSRHEKDDSPLPDKILTVGEVPKKILEKYGEYEDGLIEPSCGLRFQYLFPFKIRPRRQTGNILLALDGIPDVYKMINYAVKELKGHEHYQLTIRPHPALPLTILRSRIRHDLSKISNITISEDRSLREDFSSADIVVYWGSSLAVEALSMGIPLIYYDMGYLLSDDPLFECPHLKKTVTDKDSLVQKIEEIYSLSPEEYQEQQKKGQDFIRQYIHPVTTENLNKFLCDNLRSSRRVSVKNEPQLSKT